MRNAFFEQLHVLLGRGFERHCVRLVVQHQNQLVAQRLAQLQTQIKGDEVVADQGFLGFSHLHHAEYAEHQSHQRDRDQR